MGGIVIKIEDFAKFKNNGRTYGGHAGSKKGILIANEDWFIKYPKSTRSMEVQGLSYTTSPLSEYIGSHIYEILGILTHETRLGILDGKVVVACKDFTAKNEILVDYNSLKNNPDLMSVEQIDSMITENGLEELESVLDNNIYFKKIKGLKEHFWDMFVIDTFINNNDRNSGNWGVIFNRDTYQYRISPVYDNGASFFNKTSIEQMEKVLSDEFKIKQAFYDNCKLIYTLNDKNFNALDFIKSRSNESLNEAIIRIVPKINLEKIKEIINDIPSIYEGIMIMPDIQKEYYLKSLEYKYQNVLLPVYNALIEKN